MTQLTERAVASRVPSLAEEKLKVLGRHDPLTAVRGTSLARCIEMIQGAGTGDSVFVTEDGEMGSRLLGVLTERDIFAKLVGADADLTRPVEALMIEHPWTLHLDEPVSHAIELMQAGRYRNVPLVDEAGNLVGVVRPVDVLKYLAEAFPEELLNLPPRPHQRMKESEGA
ncbi:MAG: CBS domain-containing protein [Chloroflexi bacterium]|nr:CBS domain-containing protein [Chloroflexota bacterium]